MENKKSLDCIVSQCLTVPVFIAGIVATFALGPIDLCRSVYNQIIGDTPVLKRRLTNYVRRGISKEHSGYELQKVEELLAYELNISISENGKVDPNQASIENLWDASEDNARSLYQRWVWPSLNE